MLYGRDKDRLSKVLMFVQSHAQICYQQFFYLSTFFKCDLWRVCIEFLKSVEWIRYNVPIKTMKSTCIIRAFLDIIIIIKPEILIQLAVKIHVWCVKLHD